MFRSLKHNPSILSSDKGMTLMELMVASGIGMIIISMTLSTVFANRNAFSYDIARTRLNQNIRSAFDIINTEIRQAGERLPAGVPAIEIINGASGAPDTLILRRNLMDEVLTVCARVDPAVANANISLAATTAGLPPACSYGSQTTNYNVWRNYRLTEGGATQKVKAYIYDLAAKKGQFFDYDIEDNNSVTRVQTIHNQSGVWANVYNASASAVYLLNEWRFSLSTVPGETDLLNLTEDNDIANPKHVVYGLKDLQFRALMQDGTTYTTFTANESWTLIQAIEVTITGEEEYRGRKISTTLTTQLFPRNVLSN